jgi:hypothetical protein
MYNKTEAAVIRQDAGMKDEVYKERILNKGNCGCMA